HSVFFPSRRRHTRLVSDWSSDVCSSDLRIWSGSRVTLTYLLRRGAGGEPSREIASEDLAPRVQEAWRALLADRSFLPAGGNLALVGKAVGRGRRERLVGRWWVREVRVGQ